MKPTLTTSATLTGFVLVQHACFSPSCVISQCGLYQVISVCVLGPMSQISSYDWISFIELSHKSSTWHSKYQQVQLHPLAPWMGIPIYTNTPKIWHFRSETPTIILSIFFFCHPLLSTDLLDIWRGLRGGRRRWRKRRPYQWRQGQWGRPPVARGDV